MDRQVGESCQSLLVCALTLCLVRVAWLRIHSRAEIADGLQLLLLAVLLSPFGNPWNSVRAIAFGIGV